MSRPICIDDEVILKAAREVFLKRGFKAPSLQIAKRAGVSEGSLFKRFHTKTELFVCAMRLHEEDRRWMEELKSGVGRVPVRRALRRAAEGILNHVREMTPRIMALRASGIPKPDMAKIFGKEPPLLHVRALTEYFHKESKLGRIHLRRPEIHAHAFLGSLVHFVFQKQVFGYEPCSQQEYISQLMEIYVGGKIA
ncbi:MAG: TetR/AcrR family transcriptional regulator [bacterium]